MVGGVVIVDPFSSGANLAAGVIKMGYKLIICFSEKNSRMTQFKGSNMFNSTFVQHDNLDKDQVKYFHNFVRRSKNSYEVGSKYV